MDQSILDELSAGIIGILGGQLHKIILYGSVARGTAEEESDVDVAIIVSGTISDKDDDSLSEHVAKMDLKYDRVFSVIDIDVREFDKWKTLSPFYRNVNQEGIVLWKAA